MNPTDPSPAAPANDPERARVAEIRDEVNGWRRWGPYLSDRSWGTVREDYSENGDAWGYLPYEKARSKAYRWGEDGIAGISDRYQLLCFAPAFWNGRDPHLKERLFGLTPHEGNHGEDVKEYYFYVDNTPTHSYMKCLYKYPQAAYPYQQLIDVNRGRHGQGPEYELLDTGVFHDNRYFDIVIEYAKAGPEDICIRIEAFNRGPEAATLHILPQLWFRNTWAWGETPHAQPTICDGNAVATGDEILLVADDSEAHIDLPMTYRLGARRLRGPAGGTALFTQNETNGSRVFGPGNTSRSPHTKDAFHRHICEGEGGAVSPEGQGTKAGIHYVFEVPADGSVVLRLRLTDGNAGIAEVDAVVATRKAEADVFYEAIAPKTASADERQIQRQALAGLLWSKQCYLFNVAKWLDGDNPKWPPPASRKTIRNAHWRHLNSMRIMTMPDRWEYPWFAAWDLAFQCVPFALVDSKFAKDQLQMLLFEQFQHPSGQLPAYEWEFSDLNPPVHAWAVWRVYNMDRLRNPGKEGKGDRLWLERCPHKLLINFASWVNKVDREGNNIFEGGFLGLDNITVIDRSEQLRDGATLEQSDATGWMGMFCLNLMRIALELARENPVYEGLATKFFQHYAYVAYAMKHMGNRDYSLWDEADGFFYDVLCYPDGSYHKFRVRSLVGLIPLFAVERLEFEWMEPFKEFTASFLWFVENRQHIVAEVCHRVERQGKVTWVLTIVNQVQIARILHRLHNEDEFLAPYGVRSLSKAHERQPFAFAGRTVNYEPAEAISKLKGGNSNWRGPLWFPTTFLLIESMRKLGTAFGDDYTLQTPASHGSPIAFRAIGRDLARRMVGIFARGPDGRRPVFGDDRTFQDDPHWRDNLLFYKYFHGDTGAGLGASHQTGWTALVAALIDEWR